MARNDVAGFFWDDTPPPKPPPKAKPKRNPPPRTWEQPDYLPGIDEARRFAVDLFTDAELIAECYARERLAFDIESYPNYFCIVFQSIKSGKIAFFEANEGQGIADLARLNWILNSFTLVGFNSYTYDVPISSLAATGLPVEALFFATEEIIVRNERPQDVLKRMKVKKHKVDGIDLIEVAPLSASLKIYSGRLHCHRMQDLPFKSGTVLSDDQKLITRWYCCNDTSNTILLYNELEEQIHLREKLGLEYGVDLRSKSDAQIAEAVISHEVEKLNGMRAKRPEFAPGTCFKFQVPAFLTYKTEALRWTLEMVRNANFIISDTGEVIEPAEFKGLAIPLAGGEYRIGIGGLHSSEKAMAHYADNETILADRDVASYYPSIILNQGLFPQHLGVNFLRVYKQLVDRRLAAKNSGDKVVADSLKITINGSFGKLGSPYSILYSPHLLIQVTITGQLALLMLIERLELEGIPVVSANTDGVIIKCPKNRRDDMNRIVKQWEADTQFVTEETLYKAVFSRDVNNYIAIKLDGEAPKKRFLDERLGCKVKGAYCERGSAGNSVLSKNPAALISSDAVLMFLAKGTSIASTVRGCTDIRRFVIVRTVKGGAVKNGEYLGKAIRWYYAKGVEGEIVYALNGNKVPRSDNARPLMTLPTAFPEDVDFDWYEAEAYKILQEIAYEKTL